MSPDFVFNESIQLDFISIPTPNQAAVTGRNCLLTGINPEQDQTQETPLLLM